MANTDAGSVAVAVHVNGETFELGRMHGELDFSVRAGPARREGETDEQFLDRMKQENPDGPR